MERTQGDRGRLFQRAGARLARYVQDVRSRGKSLPLSAKSPFYIQWRRMTYGTLEIEMSDLLKNLDDRGVLTLTMNRLEKSNAFDDGLIGLLNAALLDAAGDANVKVVCLRGAGKHFSAGADLGWMQRMAKYSEAENQADAWQLAQLMNNLYRLPKPT